MKQGVSAQKELETNVDEESCDSGPNTPQKQDPSLLNSHIDESDGLLCSPGEKIVEEQPQYFINFEKKSTFL
jgi:hypothetical protein